MFCKYMILLNQYAAYRVQGTLDLNTLFGNSE